VLIRHQVQLVDVSDDALRCRLCGAELSTGLAATDSRQCCLNATPIAGICPEHGPLGPHHVEESSG